MHTPTLFDSVFLGGFECSTHRRHDGRRLDLIAATGHDRLAAEDYQRMAAHGLRSVRDGVRWHLIETTPGRYDWSSLLPMVRAARESGVQVIWDLCHYGWPDDVDIWRPAFVERFARFAGAAAALLRDEGVETPAYCPVNEISFWAWAGGDMKRFNPMAEHRGFELKHQLVRASIAAIDAIRAADPRARIVQVDPVIHVLPRPDRKGDAGAAEAARLAQYEAWDMIGGYAWPGLGGKPEYLDVIGVNYYSDNQWFLKGGTIGRDDPRYRPFADILAEVHQRYGRPVLVAETGAEGDARAPWLDYVTEEVTTALRADVPVEGICLYPILDYPGWANDRHCETGLYGLCDEQGERCVNQPLAAALERAQARIGALLGQPRFGRPELQAAQ
ncbi:beta-glucosidase [Azospirillum sp. YIM DDC1]|uniref:Beta-glucosidase n=1 Tax=Azospirillum aestuarii TaxID=2802052 RepID=A0ABS1I141_9PROT|nr:beta-glucosidase [Azospirillum aestuarii]MBK4720792.1 beta-glucosidase [Azospirillum aestuarii]